MAARGPLYYSPNAARQAAAREQQPFQTQGLSCWNKACQLLAFTARLTVEKERAGLLQKTRENPSRAEYFGYPAFLDETSGFIL